MLLIVKLSLSSKAVFISILTTSAKTLQCYKFLRFMASLITKDLHLYFDYLEGFTQVFGSIFLTYSVGHASTITLCNKLSVFQNDTFHHTCI